MVKRIGFIGHSQNNLYEVPAGWEWAYGELVNMIVKARQNGFHEYVSGMEKGWEYSAIQFVISEYKTPRFDLIIASEDQQLNWHESDVYAHKELSRKANSVSYIGKTFHIRHMIARNRQIINRSNALMICLRSDRTKGMEHVALQYAIKKKKQIYLIDPKINKAQWLKAS